MGFLMGNINVNPSNAPRSVSVATDSIDEVHYPIYKLATGGSGSVDRLVSDANPLPVVAALGESYLRDILTEQRLTNRYLSEIAGLKLTERDLEDDY